ncbi:MAG: hypothetical protein LBR73_06970 [Oscillospiraceae bacterium]|jgi:stage III sporulation protein AG|nr:hypothetical protein [Oscillospiraceae bacterium]
MEIKSDATDSKSGKPKIKLWQKIALIGGIVGILLLALSSVFPVTKKASASSATEVSVDLSSYERDMEQRLEELISSIAGAGQTKVMLTLDCSSEPVYATEGKSAQSSSTGTGSSQESLTAEKNYVIIGQGSGQQGLILKTVEPKVRGVAVLCAGAGEASVKAAITEAVTSVLGVGANKVSIGKLAAGQ